MIFIRGRAETFFKRCSPFPRNLFQNEKTFDNRSIGEFKKFLGDARGSLLEVETQILIARNSGMIDVKDAPQINELIEDCGRLLKGLIRSLGTDN